MTKPLHLLSIADLGAAIRRRELSIVALVEASLARIDAFEPEVKAWVSLDRAGALATARVRQSEARAGRLRGPLHGIPVGIKDIYHVSGMVTTAGAGSFAHERPHEDATAVARLRAAGAIILGKTQTTQFAYADPAETRNPWNLDHTPGGSSSGSAAAVALGAPPLALGTQTIGSVLRPAAYCGVVGFKPTHGRISFRGIVPAALSLDHAGVFCRTVGDAALALEVLAGYDADDPFSVDAPTDPYAQALVNAPSGPPRLGVVGGFFFAQAEPEMAAHLRATAALFARHGATVDEASLPPSFSRIHDAGVQVLQAEAAAYHASQFAAHQEEYGPKIRGLIEAGLAMPAADYVRAQQDRRRFQLEIAPVLARHDALLLPVTPGPAPRGLDSTGDPRFCAPWSSAGVPAMAIPSGLTAGGLPLAIQLVAGRFQEARLLRAAAWCESLLAFAHTPAAPVERR